MADARARTGNTQVSAPPALDPWWLCERPEPAAPICIGQIRVSFGERAPVLTAGRLAAASPAVLAAVTLTTGTLASGSSSQGAVGTHPGDRTIRRAVEPLAEPALSPLGTSNLRLVSHATTAPRLIVLERAHPAGVPRGGVRAVDRRSRPAEISRPQPLPEAPLATPTSASGEEVVRAAGSVASTAATDAGTAARSLFRRRAHPTGTARAGATVGEPPVRPAAASRPKPFPKVPIAITSPASHHELGGSAGSVPAPAASGATGAALRLLLDRIHHSGSWWASGGATTTTTTTTTSETTTTAAPADPAPVPSAPETDTTYSATTTTASAADSTSASTTPAETTTSSAPSDAATVADTTGSAAPSTAATSSGASGTGTGLYQLGATLSSVGAPGAYSIVIGDAYDGSLLAGLPGTSLAYFAGTDVSTQWSTGVPYEQALANGWLLRDSSGNLLMNQGTANNYVGDVGSSGYQQAWIANVLAYLAANPSIKGVFIDDVLYDIAALAGTESAEYPTQQAWAQAQLSFVEAVGTALRAKGYYVAVNAGGYIPGDPNSDTGANTVAWWQQLGPYVNGLMNESYQETSDGSNVLRTTGSAWTQNWDGWQRLVTTAQSMGDDFLGVTYGPAGDTQAMLYGKASFLQDWNGNGGAFMYHANDNSDPGNSAWTIDIGQPSAAKQQVGVGWMRVYNHGVALVNPDPSTAQTFQLPGSYLTSSGATVTSVTLAPTTGLILQSAP